ncbi:phosphate acyltransferase PlsX [Ihubacter sp. rT4E-8]|uniref:phosphate acyltransferase PlsX n=1 Tax=Ihubacter sp. rT4E-8 TaxID=3242369 RepID=UPI003CECED49
MKILIDGMGGDHAPKEIVAGAVAATREIDDTIIIIGKEDEIVRCLKEQRYAGDQIEIVHATDVITNHEAPVKAVRTKKDSSIVKGLNMVKNGEADVFLSAGSTGALLAGGLFILGRIQGIDRPTLATIYPVIGKQPSILVDTGANAECKPQNLLEFATMGSIYMEKVIGRSEPTIGLVNNGTEEGKGTTLTKAAYELLSKSRLNFIGSVEARELPDGACDVIVTDGFTGNAIIKLTEGMGLMVLREMKRRFMSTTKSKMGAVLLKDQLMGIKKEFNYAEYGGAPLLGVKGAMLKMHGSSDALAVKQTIIKAIPYVEQKVVETIQNSVLEIEEILISE